jgi:hypothetical protein
VITVDDRIKKVEFVSHVYLDLFKASKRAPRVIFEGLEAARDQYCKFLVNALMEESVLDVQKFPDIVRTQFRAAGPSDSFI